MLCEILCDACWYNANEEKVKIFVSFHRSTLIKNVTLFSLQVSNVSSLFYYLATMSIVLIETTTQDFVKLGYTNWDKILHFRFIETSTNLYHW